VALGRSPLHCPSPPSPSLSCTTCLKMPRFSPPAPSCTPGCRYPPSHPIPLPNSSSTVLWLVLWPVLCYAVLRCDLCFLCTAVPQVSPQGRVREMRQIVQWQVRLNGNGNGNGADDTPPSAQRSCRLAHTPTELSHVTSSRHQRSAQLMPA
jgi:hypothetical protein